MSELGQLYADLHEIFASEAAMLQRYRYFAQVATIEGFPAAASLFEELAESVACVAHGHFDFLRYHDDPLTGQPAGDTHLNLAASVSSQLTEATVRYPRLTAEAHRRGAADVASWLQAVTALKKAHATRLQAALESLPTGARTADGVAARRAEPEDRGGA